VTTPVPGPPRPQAGYRVVVKRPDVWYFVPDVEEREPTLDEILGPLDDLDDVGLATVKTPVIAHPRQTKHGVTQVEAHMREVQVRRVSFYRGVAADAGSEKTAERIRRYVRKGKISTARNAVVKLIQGPGVAERGSWSQRPEVAESFSNARSAEKLNPQMLPIRMRATRFLTAKELSSPRAIEGMLEVNDQFEPTGIEVYVDGKWHALDPSERTDISTAPNAPRLADLPDDARGEVEDYIIQNEINVQAITDEIYAGFNDPELVREAEAWYRDEFQGNAEKLSEKYDVPLPMVTAVIAITSARNTWLSADEKKHPNLETAERFLQLSRDGIFDDKTPEEAANEIDPATVNDEKPKLRIRWLAQTGFGENAIALLQGRMTSSEAITGAKRRSFYDNGMFPEVSTAVTNDTWMAEYVARHSKLPKKKAQGDISGEGPVAMKAAGINATPAYMVLTEAVLRAHERAVAEGVKIDPVLPPEEWLPHMTQALAWVLLKQTKAREKKAAAAAKRAAKAAAKRKKT
jgi:hypothetical protein